MPVFVVAAIELSFFFMLGTARNQLRHIDSTPSFYTGPNVCFVSSGYCKYAFQFDYEYLVCVVFSENVRREQHDVDQNFFFTFKVTTLQQAQEDKVLVSAHTHTLYISVIFDACFYCVTSCSIQQSLLIAISVWYVHLKFIHASGILSTPYTQTIM